MPHVPSSERGAAVVDFVLVSIPLVFLFLGVLQVGFALHVRNTLVACAADGARFGANADRGPGDAEEEARQCIGGALRDGVAQSVDGSLVGPVGGRVVRVEVTASLPVLGPFGPAKAMRVDGHAVWEGDL